jgi:hypothetical protein
VTDTVDLRAGRYEGTFEWTARALGELGPGNVPAAAVSALGARLADEDSDVREAASEAFERLRTAARN